MPPRSLQHVEIVSDVDDVFGWLERQCIVHGSDLAIAVSQNTLGLAATDTGGHHAGLALDATAPGSVVERIEREIGPRWVWWDRTTADRLTEEALVISRCWDVVTVHRLLHGGWRTSVALAWAWLHDLDPGTLPVMGQLDLLGAIAAGPDGRDGDGGDPEQPVRPDMHLRPEWVGSGWAATRERHAIWAACALTATDLQRLRLDQRPNPKRAHSTARSESAAELLCSELATAGLPIDVAEASRIISDAVGPRPAGEAEADALRRERDEAVLQHAEPGVRPDLRNPADVKTMLRRIAVDVPDTRAWRLEPFREQHPLVDALLTWRKAERIATTYGYRWLDEHVHDGRLRGEWSSSDGAAGRMTASAGLHNLPAEMRPAVAAESGHVFVRADLGQIEPRVLAAVSGDAALVAATHDADLYAPVATRLRVTRDIAKVAVLGAMYGATTGESAHALRGLEREYPVAMALLADAAAAGQAGEPVMTVGGRVVNMWVDDSVEGDIDRARRVAAARGRFARNALIQGAAAEFFKVWAVTLRSRLAELPARIVLCLHDELLVHTRRDCADEVTARFDEALAETAYRWSPDPDVRFVADVSVIERWSDAKG